MRLDSDCANDNGALAGSRTKKPGKKGHAPGGQAAQHGIPAAWIRRGEALCPEVRRRT